MLQEAGCPILATLLSLSQGWETSNPELDDSNRQTVAKHNCEHNLLQIACVRRRRIGRLFRALGGRKHRQHPAAMLARCAAHQGHIALHIRAVACIQMLLKAA